MSEERLNEERSVTQSNQAGPASVRNFDLPSREEIEDWLKEIEVASSEILNELRGISAGDGNSPAVEIGERPAAPGTASEEVPDGWDNSDRRLAMLKHHLTERLQNNSAGGEESPPGRSDETDPVSR